MRTRLIPYAGWIVLALVGIGGTSCSNLDIGQERDAPGPLNVNHVILIDSRRATNPDLLNDDAEKRAAGISSQGRACGFADPCPPPVLCGELLFQGASTGVFASYPASPGVCHDPENILEVQPSVDSVIRVSFNKLLDNRVVNVAGQVVPTALTVQDSSGNPVAAAEIFYDRSGSPVYTSDPNVLPYGPALVFTPANPLRPGATYTIRLNSTDVVARNNQQPPVAEDLVFTFTVEGLSMFLPDNDDGLSRLCPHQSADDVCPISAPVTGDTIGTGDDLVYEFTADIDISNAVIEVRSSSGTLLGGTPSIGNDPYTGRDRQLVISPPTGGWPVGTGHVVTLTGVRAADGGAVAPNFTATFDVQ